MLKRNLTSELVTKFNEALAKILEHKSECNYDEALRVLDSTLKDIFRLGMKFFNSLSDENLIEMIKTNGTINTDKCIMMAKLLEEESNILECQGKSNEAFYINLKSLNLFIQSYIGNNGDCDLQHHFSDIDIIIEKTSDYKLSFTLQNRIMDYYGKIKKYDKAEDMLFEILEDNDFNKEVLEKGLAFYKELLNKGDEDLHIGNLSKEEVEDSLNTLRKKL